MPTRRRLTLAVLIALMCVATAIASDSRSRAMRNDIQTGIDMTSGSVTQLPDGSLSWRATVNEDGTVDCKAWMVADFNFEGAVRAWLYDPNGQFLDYADVGYYGWHFVAWAQGNYTVPGEYHCHAEFHADGVHIDTLDAYFNAE